MFLTWRHDGLCFFCTASNDTVNALKQREKWPRTLVEEKNHSISFLRDSFK